MDKINKKQTKELVSARIMAGNCIYVNKSKNLKDSSRIIADNLSELNNIFEREFGILTNLDENHSDPEYILDLGDEAEIKEFFLQRNGGEFVPAIKE